MISASKSTLSLDDLKILRPKVTKILQICVRSFVNPHRDLFQNIYVAREEVCEKNA